LDAVVVTRIDSIEAADISWNFRTLLEAPKFDKCLKHPWGGWIAYTKLLEQPLNKALF